MARMHGELESGIIADEFRQERGRKLLCTAAFNTAMKEEDTASRRSSVRGCRSEARFITLEKRNVTAGILEVRVLECTGRITHIHNIWWWFRDLLLLCEHANMAVLSLHAEVELYRIHTLYSSIVRRLQAYVIRTLPCPSRNLPLRCARGRRRKCPPHPGAPSCRGGV